MSSCLRLEQDQAWLCEKGHEHIFLVDIHETLDVDFKNLGRRLFDKQLNQLVLKPQMT